MRSAAWFGMLVALAAPARAQNALEGVWRIEPERIEQRGEPVTRLLKGGRYECRNCVSHYSVRADGRFHPIVGQDFDEVAVRAVDPRTVEFRFRKGGKHAMTEVDRVSADGATLTMEVVDASAPNGRPQRSATRLSRVGTPPAGAHAVSGEWRPVGTDAPEDELSLIVRTSGGAVTMVQPTGRRFTATPGGPAVPIAGDVAGRMMRLERAGANGLRLITSIAGKMMAEGMMTAAADGRSLIYEARDVTLGQTTRFVATRR